MQLLLIIGKNSLNEPILVDVCSLPNLFVAYSYDTQLQSFFQHCINTINNAYKSGKNIVIAIAVSNSNAHLLNEIVSPITLAFIPNSTINATLNCNSKDAFILQLFTEMKSRVKQQKQGKQTAKYLPTLVVMIDELFSLILSHKKQTGIYFLQLLIIGKQVGIYFIAASASSYRNLLLQLMNMHPEIEKQLAKKQLTKNSTIVKPLGAELILTPDDLVFYKSITMPLHERYFKL